MLNLPDIQWEALYKLYNRAFIAASYKTEHGDSFVENVFVGAGECWQLTAVAMGLECATDADYVLMALSAFKLQLSDMLSHEEPAAAAE